MPDMLAIIPFYKRQDQLDKCLAALGESTSAIEPYIHDNNTNNIGYTAACNLGLREAMRRGHKYALLLNQDCYVKPDAMEKAVAFMDAHPRCAIAGPKQLHAEKPDDIIHGGCTDAYPLGRHFIGKVSNNDCAVSLPMPWVNGACMVVRVEALYSVGLMDEGYYIIASDSDFCFTARQRGWEVWYCAESVVLHEGGGVSSRQNSLEMMAHFNADQVRFRDKWIGTAGFELLKHLPPPTAATPTQPQLQQAVTAAVNHLNKNELAQAELLARHVLAHVPDQSDMLLILARTYVRQNLPALATRYAKKVVAAFPDSANAHLTLADALVLSMQAADSVPHYRRAVELGIRSPDLHNNLGVALQSTGDREGAIAEWRAALAMDPANVNIRKNLTEAGVKDLPPVPPTMPTTMPNTGSPLAGPLSSGKSAHGTFRIG